jgi:hypothetical protein
MFLCKDLIFLFFVVLVVETTHVSNRRGGMKMKVVVRKGREQKAE